jgi:hypothetical protein
MLRVTTLIVALSLAACANAPHDPATDNDTSQPRHEVSDTDLADADADADADVAGPAVSDSDAGAAETSERSSDGVPASDGGLDISHESPEPRSPGEAPPASDEVGELPEPGTGLTLPKSPSPTWIVPPPQD